MQSSGETMIAQIEASSREAASRIYSAFLTSSRGFGVVISVICVLFDSMSAAQRAAPTEGNQ